MRLSVKPSLFAELRRRNVFRAAAFYLAAAWLLAQVVTQILPVFDAPSWLLRWVIAALAVGFPFWIAFSWFYEWTPEGLKRESDVEPHESITRLTGRKLDFAIIGVLAVAVILLLTDRFVLRHGVNTQAEQPPSAQSIAVLPFVDMSQSKDQEYFSDGLSEELLDLLAKIPQIKVIARTSSFSFKGKDTDVATIARALNVATVLEGSVRKSGNTLRITAQLIRTADSTHLWSDSYDRELTDVFKVQDEIAGAVVSALKLKLLPAAGSDNARRTANIEAYNQFLLGKKFFERANFEDWRRAETAFHKALELDPDYAPAWAGLAKAQTYLSDMAAGSEAVAAAKRDALASAEKAIALAPDLADGYEARALLRSTVVFDWDGARSDLDRIGALDPNSSFVPRRRAALLAGFGLLPEAIVQIRKATDLDPLSASAWSTLGMYQVASGDFGTARDTLKHALELNPSSSFSNAYFGLNELLDGHADEALSVFKRVDGLFGLLGTALVEHTLGNAPQAQAALDAMISKYADGSAYQIAEVYAWRGDADRAFEWLERARLQHDGGLFLLNVDPILKPLRGDPRFALLRRELALPAQ